MFGDGGGGGVVVVSEMDGAKPSRRSLIKQWVRRCRRMTRLSFEVYRIRLKMIL